MSPFRKIIFVLFFLSGFCGLLYQVIWMRLAFAHFGIITPVLSVVVSVFMLGLSLGSWLGGAWISSAYGRRGSAAYAYALVEGLIGLGAFIVPKLFPVGARWLLPGGEMNSLSYLFWSAVIISLSILPWCILMGATFPFMMAFIKERESSDATSFSFLYLANVIGAMCGTILTADVLVELLGFKHTLMVAGFSNFLIAALSVVLAGRDADRSVRGKTRKAFRSDPVPTALASSERRWAYLILFVTGFTSMCLEVIWTRNFTPVLGTTVYAFALIVAVYLLATWLGSTLYRRQAAKGQFLSISDLLAALAMSSLFTTAITDPRLHLQLAGVVGGIFPFSFLLGYLTPGLIDRVAQGEPGRAGRAYAVNIIGCVLGPLVASYLLLPLCGAKGSMILMALPYAVLLVLHFNSVSRHWRVPASCFTLALLLCALFVNDTYEEGVKNDVVRRDSTATVISTGSGMDKRLYVNGVGITSLVTVTKVMAHLPLLVAHQPPRSALDICFGMGTTYRSLLTWDGLQVTAVELVPSVKKAFGYYHADAAQVMANPRGRVVIDDGRRFLSRTDEIFDVVTIDPPPPIEAAGSSLLYTREFYELMKKRMRPESILQQWFPGGPTVEAQAIARSLTEAFHYVRIYTWSKEWGVHFLASDQPIEEPSIEEAMARLPPAAQKDLVEWEPHLSARALLTRVFSQKASVEKLLSDNKDIAITDDRPFNEYYLLRRSWAHYRKLFNNL